MFTKSNRLQLLEDADVEVVDNLNAEVTDDHSPRLPKWET